MFYCSPSIDSNSNTAATNIAKPSQGVSREAFRELEHQVARLMLLNQALWELSRDRLGVTDQELEAKAREIDLRDGVEDGRVTHNAVKCPSCGRVSNSRHYRCLYCGQLFEKPVFG